MLDSPQTPLRMHHQHPLPVALVAIFAFMLSFGCRAQTQDSLATHESWNMTFGMLFAPQALHHFTHEEMTTRGITPLYFVAPITHKQWTLTPFYGFIDPQTDSAGTSIGLSVSWSHLLIGRQVLGLYGIGNRSTVREHGFLGVGVDIPTAKPWAYLFLEAGRTYGERYETHIYAGVFLSFTIKDLEPHHRPKAR